MDRRMAIFRVVANGGAGCRVGSDNGSDNRLKSRVDGKSTQMGLRIDVNVKKKIQPGGIMSRDCPRRTVGTN